MGLLDRLFPQTERSKEEVEAYAKGYKKERLKQLREKGQREARRQSQGGGHPRFWEASHRARRMTDELVHEVVPMGPPMSAREFNDFMASPYGRFKKEKETKAGKTIIIKV